MRITRVEPIPVRVPLKAGMTAKTAHGEHAVSAYVLVRVHTDAGLVGLGEATISDSLYSGAPGFGANGFEICDDEALVWLSPELQQATNPATGHPYYADAKAYIQAHAADLHIQKLLDRDELTKLYEDPFGNSRVPDFIAITDHGVICTGGSKLAEHGGFSDDDRNVALVVSSSRIKHGKVVEDTTFTTQIAPTILEALDLDPRALQAVREEGVEPLKQGETAVTH